MTTKTVLLPCPFCGARDMNEDEDADVRKCVAPTGWLDGKGNRGPECLSCGATALSVEHWNTRLVPPARAVPRENQMVVTQRDGNGLPVVWCDPEIADLVKALNDAGIATVGSCSGHGFRPATIILNDGREVMIVTTDEMRALENLWPLDINGDPIASLPARAVGDDARQVLEQCNRFLSNYDGENVWDMQRKIRALLATQPVDGDPPIDWKRRAEIAEAKLLRLKASGIRQPVGFGDFVPVDALLAAAPADTVEHGCYCDLEPHMQPDGCVLEEGRPQNCTYARNIDKKEQCEYWIPVTRENHQKYGVIWSDKPPAEGK